MVAPDIDLSGFMQALLGWALGSGLLVVFVSHHFKKQEKREDIDRRDRDKKDELVFISIESLRKDMGEIKVQLASTNVQGIHGALTGLQKDGYKHDSEIKALFRIVDELREAKV